MNNEYVLNDHDFNAFRRLFEREIGIELPDSKRALLVNRLSKRMRARQLDDFGEYFLLISDARESAELQQALDAITTNETYFWREEKHFEFLKNEILQSELQHKRPASQAFRVWSAACSSGEEPYSIAMLLAEQQVSKWELLASDVSLHVLQQAQRAIYPLERVRQLPLPLLHRYALKGEGPQEGYIRVENNLRKKVVFKQINLKQKLPDIGTFDLILLRNVMIYFDLAMKQYVVQSVCRHLNPGGYLFVGHSENLHGILHDLQQIHPAIYRLPP